MPIIFYTKSEIINKCSEYQFKEKSPGHHRKSETLIIFGISKS